MDEQAENYEMQYLSLNEQINVLKTREVLRTNDIARLLRIVDHHLDECLPQISFELTEDDEDMLAHLHG
jgi:hypothetical protein